MRRRPHAPSPAHRRRPALRRWHPSAEGLEDRALLAAFLWDGATADFGVAAHWTGPNNIHAVPGPADDASAPGGSYTITVSDSRSVNSFTGFGALSIAAGGSLTVSNRINLPSSTIANLEVASGGSFTSSAQTTNLTGAGIIAGNLNAPAGTTIHFDGSGNGINLNAGATLTGAGTFLLGADLVINASITAPANFVFDAPNSVGLQGPGTLTVPPGATFDWRAGTMSGLGGVTSIAAGGTLKIDGAGAKNLTDRALNNAGNTSFSDIGDLTISGVGTLTNSGNLAIQNDQRINGPGTVVNTGTLTKISPSGTGTSLITAVFNNTGGTTRVTSGVLQLDNAGTNTGTFDVPGAAGTLALTGAGYSLNTGTTFTGTGLVRVTAGFFNALINVNATNVVTIPNLAFDSGTIRGPGTLRVPGTLSVNNGTFANAQLRIPTGATVSLAGTNNATFDQGILVVDAGTTTLSGSEGIQLSNGASFNNYGSFTIQDDQTIGPGSGGTFGNHGTVNKISPTGTGKTSITSFFNNYADGTVVAQTGFLELDNRGTSTGTFNVPNAAGTLQIVGNGYSLNSGATFTGAGVVDLATGFFGPATVFLNGTVTIPNLKIDAGTISGPGTLTVPGTLTINSGTLSIARLNLPSSPKANLILNGTGTATFDKGVFVDAGDTTISGAESFRLTGGALFNTYGTFNIQNDTVAGNGSLSSDSTTSFYNTGTIIKNSPVGTGSTTIGSNTFVNSGAINVNSGQLLLDDIGTSTGAFNVAAGAVLDFTRAWNLNAGTTFSGGGTVGFGIGFFGYGQVIVNANITAPSFALPGGTLTVSPSATFTVTNFNWTAGIIAGTGTVAVPSGGSLAISGSGSKTLSQATFSSAGNATWTGIGNISLDSGATFTNQAVGTFTASNDQMITGSFGGTFNNYGTLTKTSLTGVGTTTFQIVLNNLSRGVINVSSGNLAAGTSLVSLGTINLGVQTALNVSGNYTQTGTGTLNVAVGGAPGTGLSGKLTVTGAATLNGQLGVYAVNGFTAAVGQVTPLLTYQSASGRFATLVLTPAGPSVKFSTAQNPTEYDLDAIAGP